jgi:dipeptidyl aminopeptidase/acylaminoacyl peptidase
MRRCLLLALSFIVGPLAIAVPAQSAPRTLTFEDLRRIVSVREPQISPDGKRVVYVRSRVNWKANRYDSELVIADVATGASHVLTRGRFGVASPRWSPDGSKIAYVASEEQKKPPQIFVLRMDGGDSDRITNKKSGVQSFAWRPDSNSVAYIADDEPANKKDIEHHLDAVTITDNDYLTRETPQPAHLWTVDADGSHDTRLNSGTWSVTKDSEPVWSPDGRRIFYQHQPDPVFAHFVQQTTYVYDVGSKTDSSLNAGTDSDPHVSHDGKLLAVSVPRHGTIYLHNDVSVRLLSGGNEVFSSRALDRNPNAVAWLPNDAGLDIAGYDGIRNVLWTLPVKGSASKIDTGDLDVAPDFTVASDGSIAFVGLRSDHPADIYYLRAGSTTPKRLSDENAWMDGFDMPRVEELRWRIDNGMTADGVLYYPNGYVPGRKYPLVLDIHGGPISTSTRDFAGIEGGGLAQILAAHGYFVLRPNYRGSDNAGDAFLQAIVGDMASGPGKDNLAGVDAVRKLGVVDEKRIGVSGWSGGGLQTSWLIGHADFWRAAVSGAAVNDQYQQAMLSDINEPFNQAFFPGISPYSKEGRAQYMAESPITYADRVKTPTLILSDTRDQRVPVPQAYEFYHALRAHNVPVEFVAFPRYGHFPTDPVGRERVLRRWTGWFERWMK